MHICTLSKNFISYLARGKKEERRPPCMWNDNPQCLLLHPQGYICLGSSCSHIIRDGDSQASSLFIPFGMILEQILKKLGFSSKQTTFAKIRWVCKSERDEQPRRSRRRSSSSSSDGFQEYQKLLLTKDEKSIRKSSKNRKHKTADDTGTQNRQEKLAPVRQKLRGFE